MTARLLHAVALASAALAALPQPVAARWEWSGSVAAEWRDFPEEPGDPRQLRRDLSLAFQPEAAARWDDGRQQLVFAPFLRLDSRDAERRHADIRQLDWSYAADTWELRAGIRKVFWGVTESQHLVDVINQTDGVEDIDGEDKLGQPMLNLALIRDWGTVDFFLMPWFRERTFPGIEGRPRTQPYVAASQARYESADGAHHLDWAVRWFRSAGDWDIGVSRFSGTSREPRLLPGTDNDGAPALIPYYDLIEQTGLDLQTTKGAWLWKLEAISRSGQGERFAAATGGFEYTITGALGSAADLGVIAEYLYDDRGAAAPTPFENDLMLGLRMGFNDVQSSELLVGVIADRDSPARSYSLEGSRRLGERWKMSVKARAFSHIPAADPLFGLRHDDYLALNLAYYF